MGDPGVMEKEIRDELEHKIKGENAVEMAIMKEKIQHYSE